MKNIKWKIQLICSKKFHFKIFSSQKGYVIPSSLLVLVLVTILGVMSIRTSTTDVSLSANTEIYKRSFYSAEAARAYVRNNQDLYGPNNITAGTPVNFPDADNPLNTATVIAGHAESFNGTVEYLNPGVPPRGSGFQVGKYKAHHYRMICQGYGPRESRSTIQAGFYRIGL